MRSLNWPFFPFAVAPGDRKEKRWRRQLTLRADLTMHTAFDRAHESQKTPTSLMSIAISRDHRCVLVGDAKGRVFAWSVPGGGLGGGGSGASDQSASGQDASGVLGLSTGWSSRDEPVMVATSTCAAPACGTRFSITERKHQCKNCGKFFCSRQVTFSEGIRSSSN